MEVKELNMVGDDRVVLQKRVDGSVRGCTPLSSAFHVHVQPPAKTLPQRRPPVKLKDAFALARSDNLGIRVGGVVVGQSSPFSTSTRCPGRSKRDVSDAYCYFYNSHFSMLLKS